MNNSIIRKMFLGEMSTLEEIPLSKEYKAANEKMIAMTDEFLEELNDKQKELFDKTFMQLMLRSEEYATDHFVEGFKFGLLIGIECGDNDK